MQALDSQKHNETPPGDEETHPTWKLLRAEDRDVLTLGGDWIAQSGRHPGISR